MMSSSRITRSSSPSTLTVWPEYLPKRTRSPTLTSIATRRPASITFAGTDGDHFALIRLFAGRVRNDDAEGGRRFGLKALDDDAVMQKDGSASGKSPKDSLKSLDAVLKSHCLIDGGELGMQQIHTGGMSLEAHPLPLLAYIGDGSFEFQGLEMKKFFHPLRGSIDVCREMLE